MSCVSRQVIFKLESLLQGADTPGRRAATFCSLRVDVWDFTVNQHDAEIHFL
jgi:hypothetical protein